MWTIWGDIIQFHIHSGFKSKMHANFAFFKVLSNLVFWILMETQCQIVNVSSTSALSKKFCATVPV